GAGTRRASWPDACDGRLERGDQGRKLVRDRVPDAVEAHIEVPVREAIPHADDLRPRNLGNGSAHFRRDVAGGLAHDLDHADEGIDEQLVGVEVRARATGYVP